MKRLIGCALIAFIAVIGACKKSEEPKANDPKVTEPTAKEQETFKPQGKKAKKDRQAKKGKDGQPKAEVEPTNLEIYNEKNLVTSITPAQYNVISVKEVKMGDNKAEGKGILLTDLLNKYNVKGKNVHIIGPTKTVSLTWDQIQKGDVYVVVTKKNRIKVVSMSKDLAKTDFPKKVERLTVSDSTVAAAPAKEDKPKT